MLPAAQRAGAAVGLNVLPALARALTVVAWGRNAEYACGVEQVPLVTRPTTLLDLHGRSDIVAVRAGKLNSAAVTAAGEALTWGDGKSAKLGHGNDEHVPAPARVESLVGRAEVSNLALGDQHSLFLDRAGGLWAVGCSLEGQCGLGTPIEELARQHRRALYGSMQVEALLRNRPSASGAASGRHEAYLRAFAEAHRTIAEQRQRQQQRQQHARQALAASFLRPAAARGLGAAQYAGAIGGGGGGGSHGAAAPQLGISSSGIWGVDIERHLSATGLQPGVVHVPTRVMEARQLDATWGLGDGNGGGSGGGSSATMSDPLGSASSRDSSSSSSSSSSSRSSSGGGDSSSDSSSGGGLEHERVVGVDCSRYFSIAVTHKGERGRRRGGCCGRDGRGLPYCEVRAAP
ncbi:hypothetical protein MNEG_3123 [Monoraphidium neglectum]|uniref:Uncharacterized protein n=1 Tax=Monoraphidium neglectum TaxID=145388 RepID=A0A0D2NIU5_9CHLO|nr:hypothetical protein MNEG_3123 [Monoraphidium neglectum]KIZ04841.1 hypothetical protein MNEG_3123 [Monoraphidium neglectum]|eukprot:XP_013903860.1 hypothetical protein MNEG_3123 [Monoraphidium neglectum]